MNFLSVISFFNAYSYIFLGIYALELNPKKTLNKLGASVDFCFAIWDFAYAFFYSAPTFENALFWHRISSFGWIFFCAFAAHFFIILSEKNKEWVSIKYYIVLYTLPVILFIKTLFGKDTPVAKGFIQSKMGWGWTYDSNISSMWFWIYILYILIYFGIALYFTYTWAKRKNKLRFIKQSKSIIALDIIMIIAGFFTDIILPAIYPMMPPLYSVISIVWAIGIFYIVKNFKLLNVYNVASPEFILETVMDPIIMLDDKGIIITCNQATEKLFKCQMKQIINKPLYDFCKSKEYGDELHRIVFNKKVVRNVEINLVDSYGRTINALISSSIAESKLDGVVGLVLNIHDITMIKKMGEELYKRKEKYKELSKHYNMLANYDELTGIPNRRMFFNELKSAIKNYEESGIEFAIVFIDLDGFKAVNDSFGHDVGDSLLTYVSRMFAASIEKQDIIARIGGDEFVIILSDLQGRNFKVYDILQKVKEEFLKPIIINNNACSIGISFGISKCPEDGVTTDELVNIADKRMYKYKISKKNNK